MLARIIKREEIVDKNEEVRTLKKLKINPVLFIIILFFIILLIMKHKDDIFPSNPETSFANQVESIQAIVATLPDLQEEIANIKTSPNQLEMPIVASFSAEKFFFRLEAERTLLNQEIEVDLKQHAEQIYQESMQLLKAAETEYGITLNPNEVAHYIEENFSNTIDDNQEMYAEALGIQLDQYEKYFQRDLHIFNLLFSKLYPALHEKYPQETGEEDSAYEVRLREEIQKQLQQNY